jgi:peptidoglycan/LPS O-acetylase OafA/YrhL
MKNLVGRLPELDALRGIAAVGVVLCHLTSGRPQGEHFLKYGFTGVDLFFMISGFVILMSLENIKSWKDFVFRRAIRLYPAYWVAVILTAILLVYLGFEHYNSRYLIKSVANLTMFQPFLLQEHLDNSYWTLIVEMHFYIIMLILYRLRMLKRIEVICSIFLVALLAVGTYLRYYPPSIPTLWIIYRYAAIIICFPSFAAGIVYYKIMTEQVTAKRLLLLALCLVTTYSFGTTDPRVLLVKPFNYYLILVLFNVIFFLFVKSKLKFIVNKITLFYGAVSYSIYLINGTICFKLFPLLMAKHVEFWPSAILTLGVLTALSFLITKFIENPVQRYVKGKWLKPNQTASVATDSSIW